MMMSAITTRLIAGLSAKYVSDEYGVLLPIRSNPALQKADIEWNTAYHIPFPIPNSWQKEGAMSTAPASSKTIVILTINPVRFTIPPTLWAEIASCIVLRCFKLIFLPDTVKIATATVTTPIPPICISPRMTAWPKPVQ